MHPTRVGRYCFPFHCGLLRFSALKIFLKNFDFDFVTLEYSKLTKMQKALKLAFLFVVYSNLHTSAQTICNPSGNIFIVSNYDGGTLNIVVDVNIPNLKIGVVSYEAIAINISGAFSGNVSEVRYAGYNSQNNNNCSLTIPTTVITGVPGTAQTSISFAPPAPTANPNGNSSIICAYDCDTLTSQGGCNTVDQVEDYFLQVFSGGSVYAHRTQYNCYQGQVLLSNAGNCCASPQPAISIAVSSVNASCFGVCDGSATVVPSGGVPPFTYQWSNGPSTADYDSLCAGIYFVTVTDSTGLSTGQSVSIVAPNALAGTFSITADNGTCNGAITLNPAGGNGAPYTFSWDSCGNGAGSITANVDSLCAGTCCVFLTDASGCVDTFCVAVPLSVGINDINGDEAAFIYPNPSNDGLIVIKDVDISDLIVVDMKGRIVDVEILKAERDACMIHLSESGIYQCRWRSENNMRVARVIVQKQR
jgi:hypothetical protein